VVIRYIHEEMSAYDQIVEKFFQDDLNELLAVILSSESTLKSDNNMGIAKQLISAWKCAKISNISKSYLTLSVPVIKESLKFSDEQSFEIEKILYSMINEEKIIASIHPTTNVINFDDEMISKKFFLKRKQELSHEMEHSMSDIISLSHLLREQHKEILTSTDYIQKMTSTNRPGGSMGGGGFWGVSSTMEFS
jgi:hypothetical protein